MNPNIRIGTSGWSYKHWKEIFYPKNVPQKKWLPYYAQCFDTTEINGSFYRLPSAKTIANWVNSVPDGFIFCPKMSRYLTHMKKLREPEEPLERFFSVFDGMSPRMGPVLIQLPPQLRFDAGLAEHFYQLATSKYAEYDFVLEIRHSSWLHDQSLSLMTQYAMGLVIAESGKKFPYSERITAKNIYIRFHGPEELFASSYSDKDLEYFAVKCHQWAQKGYKVWAYFNNDIHGHALKNALRLKQMLQ